MQIRYGFDVALDLAQPTTILTMMDVHSDFQRCVAEETELERRLVTATAILATLACRLIPRRWISTLGSKLFSAIDGSPSSRGIIGQESAAS